ncbi:proteoglycan 4-like isoform X2 [Hemicordylus capensis]|uniref:proteoglycan 4-like isoform X2 n=1 Tax=Hemicordylus capensis TaxID=884348 RepID=UPI0023034787|nr:proteoglycan 4-like isoform X2 [Hemicordylus capensis]
MAFCLRALALAIKQPISYVYDHVFKKIGVLAQRQDTETNSTEERSVLRSSVCRILQAMEAIRIQEPQVAPGMGASCRGSQHRPKEPVRHMPTPIRVTAKNATDGWCGLSTSTYRILQEMEAGKYRPRVMPPPRVRLAASPTPKRQPAPSVAALPSTATKKAHVAVTGGKGTEGWCGLGGCSSRVLQALEAMQGPKEKALHPQVIINKNRKEGRFQILKCLRKLDEETPQRPGLPTTPRLSTPSQPLPAPPSAPVTPSTAGSIESTRDVETPQRPGLPTSPRQSTPPQPLPAPPSVPVPSSTAGSFESPGYVGPKEKGVHLQVVINNNWKEGRFQILRCLRKLDEETPQRPGLPTTPRLSTPSQPLPAPPSAPVTPSTAGSIESTRDVETPQRPGLPTSPRQSTPPQPLPAPPSVPVPSSTAGSFESPGYVGPKEKAVHLQVVINNNWKEGRFQILRCLRKLDEETPQRPGLPTSIRLSTPPQPLPPPPSALLLPSTAGSFESAGYVVQSEEKLATVMPFNKGSV